MSRTHCVHLLEACECAGFACPHNRAGKRVRVLAPRRDDNGYSAARCVPITTRIEVSHLCVCTSNTKTQCTGVSFLARLIFTLDPSPCARGENRKLAGAIYNTFDIRCPSICHGFPPPVAVANTLFTTPHPSPTPIVAQRPRMYDTYV